MQICGGINHPNVPSIINTLFVAESTELPNPPLSDVFNISVCISLTNINIIFFVKTSFWFDYGFKMLTTSLETHDGLRLVWESIHSEISSLSRFYGMIYWTTTHFFQCKNFNYGYFSLILCPLPTKLSSDLRPSLVSFVNCFIVVSKCVGLEALVLISSSSEVNVDSNIEQLIVVIIISNQPFVSLKTCPET